MKPFLSKAIFIVSAVLIQGCSSDCLDPGESFSYKKGDAVVYPINKDVLDSNGSLKPGATNEQAGDIKKLWYPVTYKNDDGDIKDLIVWGGLKTKIVISGVAVLKGFNDTISIPAAKVTANSSSYIPGSLLTRVLSPDQEVNIDYVSREDGYFKLRKTINTKSYNIELSNGAGLTVDAYEASSQDQPNLSMYSNQDTWGCNTGLNGSQWQENLFKDSLGAIGATSTITSHKNINFGLCDPDYTTQPCDLGYTCDKKWKNAQMIGDASAVDSDGQASCYAYVKSGLLLGFSADYVKTKSDESLSPKTNFDKVNKIYLWPAEYKKDNISKVDNDTGQSILSLIGNLNFAAKPIETHLKLFMNPIVKTDYFARCNFDWKAENWMAIDEDGYFENDDNSLSGFYLNKSSCSQVENEYSLKEMAAFYGGLLRYSYSVRPTIYETADNLQEDIPVLHTCRAPAFTAAYENQIVLFKPLHSDYERSSGVCDVKINGSIFKINYDISAQFVGEPIDTLKSDLRSAIKEPKWDGLPTLFKKGAKIDISTDPNKTYNSSDCEDDSRRQCGVATAFRVVPLNQRACLTGYTNKCANKMIQDKITQEAGSDQSKEYDLIQSYCGDMNYGMCVRLTKHNNTVGNVSKSDKYEAAISTTDYVNDFNFSNLEGFKWNIAVNTKEDLCGVCVEKKFIESSKTTTSQIIDYANAVQSAKDDLISSRQACVAKGYSWLKEYKDKDENKIKYIFNRNTVYATCKDDKSVEKTIDKSGVSVKSLIEYKASNGHGSGDLTNVHKYTVPSKDNYGKSLNRVNLFFYVAGELDSSKTVMTQHEDFSPTKDETYLTPDLGYDISVWTGEQLKDGEGMYMYIQRIDTDTKKLDDAAHPAVLFKGLSLATIVRHPLVVNLADLIAKDGDSKDYFEYIPNVSGKMWFIIPDLPKNENDTYRDGTYIKFINKNVTAVNSKVSNVDYYNTGAFKVSMKAKQPNSNGLFIYNLIDYLIINSIKDFMFGGADGQNRDWESGFIYRFTTILTKNIYFQMIFYVALTLSVLIDGIRVAMGDMKIDIKVGSKKFLEIGLIMALISPQSWNFYQKFGVEIFINIADGLANLFTGSLGDTIPNNPGILKKTFDYGKDVSQNGVDMDDLNPSNIIASFGLTSQDSAVNFKPLDEVINFLFSSETLIRLLALMSSISGLVTLIMLLISFVGFLGASIKGIIMYISCIMAIAIYGCLGPIFVLSLVNEKTKSAFTEWWKSMLGFALQQGVVFLGIYIFATIYLQTLKNMLLFGVCIEPLIVIPIINLTILSWWTVQGTVPSQMKNYMPEYKDLNQDAPSVSQAIFLMLLALCLSKILSLIAKIGSSMGDASSFLGTDQILKMVDSATSPEAVIAATKGSGKKNKKEKKQ